MSVNAQGARINHPTMSERLIDWRGTTTTPTRLRGLPPGPRTPLPVQTFRIWGARQHFLPAMQRRYGDVFTLHVAPVGQLVVVCDPDEIRKIFRGKPEVFHTGGGNSLLRPIAGPRSVVTLNGQPHRAERRRMTPPFHGERIAAVLSTMEELTERELSRWPIDQSFPLLARTQQLSLDIIVRVVMGVVDSGRAEELGKALRRFLAVNLVDMPMWLWPRLARVWPWRRVVREMDHADSLIYSEIAHRRGDPERSRRSDVLAMLLDDDPDDDLVRDELVTLLVAGHETAAVGLAWMFERLLRSPNALARVNEGLDDPHDPYRAAVVKEALRVRPVVYNVSRRITEPLELAGYQLPAGTFLAPSIGALHSDTRIWGSDAGEFRPERWLEADPPQHAWIPFGGGARRCVGALFAQTEMETVLRTVLRHVELVPDRSTDELQKMHNITVVPNRGTRVRVVKRLT
ncbi:Cytochrome P450 [Nocardia amikacinitolerans]|uniref:cytochrome P450 n=2 Tax=Nocardia amikacinitolerans TaxID=756689 RepID=UPI000B1401A2|nr:cytochrome P450 [Nocardia amikacinitolerans]MCP2321467.1 Cytochrome P450 [Nocardia amikacinitolerans]